VNDLFIALGIGSLKPIVSAFVCPPIPMIVLVILGAFLITRHPRTGRAFVVIGCVALWFSMTPVIGTLLAQRMLQLPPPLAPADIEALKDRPDTAIVVLGGGRRAFAAEFGDAALTPGSVERLQYGIWLARATDLPIAFSGGVGWRGEPGPTEADIAARVAEREFGEKLRWIENQSRDTRENAINTVALLQPDGIRRFVVVTNQIDMPRAVRNFERAASAEFIVVPAPMDVEPTEPSNFMKWLPGPDGYQSVCTVIHEWLGLLAGA
jgi:uncharacterized SAM-binding protein YcdF (DUF218 family)